MRDPDVYDQDEKVVLAHGCRYVNELAYDKPSLEDLPKNEWLGDQVRSKLVYFPTVAREAFRNRGRTPTLLESGQWPKSLGLQPINRDTDRFMLCGNPEMLGGTRSLFDKLSLAEGSMSRPEHCVIGPLVLA